MIPAVVAEIVRALLFNVCSNTHLKFEGLNTGVSVKICSLLLSFGLENNFGLGFA